MNLDLAEKVFNGIPKLFCTKFKPGFDGNTYKCLLNKNLQYFIEIRCNKQELFKCLFWDDLDELVQKVYNNAFLDITAFKTITLDDLDVFPISFKEKILQRFLCKIKSYFKNGNSVIIRCEMPKYKSKSISFSSFEELLMKIDMNVIGG